jgi:carboxyl-terminal processing protease
MTAMRLSVLRTGCAVAVAALTSEVALAGPKPIYVDAATKRVEPKLLGTWREAGNGRLIVVHAEGFDLYHTTKLLCYRDPTGQNLTLDSRYALYDLDRSGRRLRLFFHDLGRNTERFQNHERFTRLGALPKECVSSLSSPAYESPEFIFDLFWQTFDDHYAFFDRRGIDWAEVRRTYRPRVRADTTREQLYDLFVEILSKLDDGHVHLYLGRNRHFQAGANVVLERLRTAFAAQKEEPDFRGFVTKWAAGLKQAISTGFLDGPVHRAANDNIWWGSVNADVGYINIYLMTAFIKDGDWRSRARQIALVDDTFDEIFEAFRGKSAILLDLTHNQGGFDEASNLMVSRFADRRRHVLTLQPKGVALKDAEKIFAEPSSRARFTRPVYVLTSPITVSAGEGLLLALKSLPHVRHLGEPTRGYMSGILNKPLPGDFMVSVTSAAVLTPSGTAFEGKGVPPDLPMEVFPQGDMSAGYRRALDAALKHIANDLHGRKGAGLTR